MDGSDRSTQAGPSAAQQGATLEHLPFDNQALRSLPVEPGSGEDVSVRQVPGACFSRVPLAPLDRPQLVAVSLDALALLDIGPDQVARPEFAEYFAGNRLLPGAEPAAHCYAGYQFGLFSGQLGDGAAKYLGEVVNRKGERWELQLKGAGLTPYSRSADGRKVLRSSIREFLASEALYYLGVPTTRAGALVTSDSTVERDVMYSGHPRAERCSVVARIAPTFLRFGSIEICLPTDATTGRRGPSAGQEKRLLPGMVDFTIRAYFPAIWAAHGGDTLAPAAEAQRHDMYLDWYREVVRRTAALVAAWQCCGFCHGVLNTDNMSIAGLTLDYGPFGFMDTFNPAYVCNHSDDGGRYSYEAQPEICRWNCGKLAEALKDVMPRAAALRELATFDEEYNRCYWRTMRRKLGLLQAGAAEPAADEALINDLLAAMAATGADFTNTFRRLAMVPIPPPGTSAASEDTNGAAGGHTHPSAPPEPSAGMGDAPSSSAASDRDTNGGAAASTPADPPDGGFLDWLLPGLAPPAQLAAAAGSRIPASNLAMLQALAQRDPGLLAMMGATPQMLQEEVKKAKRAAELRALSPEAKRQRDAQVWRAWLGRYSARLAAEAAAGGTDEQRHSVMNRTNPRYVLRNWIAQQAIERAEAGDFSEVQRVLEVLQRPYDDHNPATQRGDRAGARAHAGGAQVAADGGDVADADAAMQGASGDEAANSGGGACALRAGSLAFDGPVPAWARKLCVSCSS